MGLVKNLFGTTATTSDGVKLPRTAQDTIPYTTVYPNGIIESRPGYFTKSYILPDIGFRTMDTDAQENVFELWKQLKNSFDSDITVQLNVNNRNVDESVILNNILSKHTSDKFNALRSEVNTILKEKVHEGNNTLQSEKTLVIGGEYADIKEATNDFLRMDSLIAAQVQLIAGNDAATTRVSTTKERLRSLHDILNCHQEHSFDENIDLSAIAAKGLSTKDIISPSAFRFDTDTIRIGDNYACVMFIKNFPASLSTEFFADLSLLPFNFVASFTSQSLDLNEAKKLVSHRATDIRGNVIKAEKQAFKSGYGSDLISPTLRESQEQAEDLLDSMKDGDQKLFSFSSAFMPIASSLEDLKQYVSTIVELGNRHNLVISKLLFQQEVGFRDVLPLAHTYLPTKRLITSDADSLFLPFVGKELIQKGGIYYGVNATSGNLIVYNRLKARNQNGLIFGMSGFGKSFAAKREMLSVFLNTNHDIIILDPDGEYSFLVEQLGGNVIKIGPGSTNYLNPFDMDMHYGDGEGGHSSDPLPMKVDFISMLCETAIGRRSGLTNIERSIISRVASQMYSKYIRHMDEIAGSGITCDINASPTFDVFYRGLLSQPEPEAKNIALNLEMYCTGVYDFFAHHTNVDTSRRIVAFNIRDIGTGLREIGLQVCLNHVWNKMIANFYENKSTWLYIDEFHELLKTDISTNYVLSIWKRARKWRGVPTAITQSISDILVNETAQELVSQTGFMIMLHQENLQCDILTDLYNLSDSQRTFLQSPKHGVGLLRTLEGIVPFEDKYPDKASDGSELQSYLLLSSSPEDVAKRKAAFAKAAQIAAQS